MEPKGATGHRYRSITVALLVAFGVLMAPSRAEIARASSYTYACDGTKRTDTWNIAQDVTPQPYYINEVLSILTAVTQYPCSPIGSNTWGAQYDFPYILGANLQYTGSGSDGRQVQMGFGRCNSNGNLTCNFPSGKEVLVYTAADDNFGMISLASWWNQGLGPGVVKAGDRYEMVIFPTGSNWEFEIEDINAPGWQTHLIANNWPTHLGGNSAWWGSETNNFQSVNGVRVIDPSFLMHSMEWRQSDTFAFHAVTAPDCLLFKPSGVPSWFQCAMAGTGNDTMEAWTNAH